MKNQKISYSEEEVLELLKEFRHVQLDVYAVDWFDKFKKINKMNLQDLKNRKTVMIKPNGLINYREMEITPTQKGFTFSNYGNKMIEGNEYLYEVNTQEHLDALDILQ